MRGASAGASLMPSPAMATMRPSLLKLLDVRLFWSGKTSATTSSIPSCRATASAVVRLSPVSITIRNPSAWSRESPPASSLDGIGHAEQPGKLAVDGDETSPSALAAETLRPVRESQQCRCRFVEQRAIAEGDLFPSTVRSLLCRSPTETRTRVKVGCLSLELPLPRSPRPVDVRCRARGWRPNGEFALGFDPATSRRHQLRLPFGQRAGLVDDQRVDLLEHFDRFGVLDEYAGLWRLASRRP